MRGPSPRRPAPALCDAEVAVPMTCAPASDRLEEHARQWGVTVESVQRTESSLVALGRRRDQSVVLKVARRHNEEWRSGEFLSAFEGHGCVRALESAPGAVLLERLTPGHNLVSLSASGRDDDATEIIADILARMASVRPSVRGFTAVQEFIPEFRQFGHHCEGLMPPSMITKAELSFAELCASQSDIRLLHGDLHHANVLFDARQGWVAIDPFGLLAEIEYEVGASLRNPADAPELLMSRHTLENRLRIYEKRLGFDADRALRWAFSQAVLAALWPTEPGVGVDMRVPFITAADTMLTLIERRADSRTAGTSG